MSDIVELERRISAALGRIEAGIGPLALAQPADENAPSSDELAAIQTHLEEERMVNAQLEERVRLLKERQDKTLGMLEQKASQQQLMISTLDTEMQSLRQSNAELREIGDQMRAALNEAVAEPELINRAMQAELDALRADRSVDIAEVDAMIAQLRDVVEEAV